MRSEAFLIFTADGIDRLVKTLPQRLGAGQFAVCIRLDVPDGFFRQATPTVNLTIPASAALGPPVRVDLSSVQDVCLVENLVAVQGDGNSHDFTCPSCGFRSWKKEVGPHYKPEASTSGKRKVPA